MAADLNGQGPIRPSPERILSTVARELASVNDNRYYLLALVDELQVRIDELVAEKIDLIAANEQLSALVKTEN